MELVTEPVMHSSGEVVKFGQELQLLLQYLGIAEANMEKGEMRLEANISLAPRSLDEVGVKKLGTKVEVKNLNSFRSAERAIEYEIKRQTELLEETEGAERSEVKKVVQETRGWDDKKQITFSQRSKEDSHDYRYFSDPDLPKLKLSELPEFSEEILRREIKETPVQKRERFKKDYGLKESDVIFYISYPKFGVLFEETSVDLDQKDFQLLSNYIVSDIASFGKNGFSIKPKHLSNLISMVVAGEISSRGAKGILGKMIENERDPKIIVEEGGLFQKSNEEELTKVASKIISENQNVVLEYKSGKASALHFLIGQGMKTTGGSANPQKLKDIFEKIITQTGLK